jgi:hypothetical protein
VTPKLQLALNLTVIAMGVGLMAYGLATNQTTLVGIGATMAAGKAISMHWVQALAPKLPEIDKLVIEAKTFLPLLPMSPAARAVLLKSLGYADSAIQAAEAAFGALPQSAKTALALAVT